MVAENDERATRTQQVTQLRQRRIELITEIAKSRGTFYRGVWHIPVNVCSHCGEADDPQDTRHWPGDDDGDRICPTCAEADYDVATKATATNSYCPIDGTLLNEDGECERCSLSAADEQRDDDIEDMEYEL